MMNLNARPLRIARALLGLALISLVFIGPRTSWGWLGLVPLVMAIAGICPLYLVIGKKPCCGVPGAGRV